MRIARKHVVSGRSTVIFLLLIKALGQFFAGDIFGLAVTPVRQIVQKQGKLVAGPAGKTAAEVPPMFMVVIIMVPPMAH